MEVTVRWCLTLLMQKWLTLGNLHTEPQIHWKFPLEGRHLLITHCAGLTMIIDLNIVIKPGFTSSFKYLRSYFRSGTRQVGARELPAELTFISHPQCLVLRTECFTFLASLKIQNLLILLCLGPCHHCY